MPRASQKIVSSHRLEILKIMELIPVFLFTFKILVFGTGMFFVIKWHYDKEKKNKEKKD